MDRLRAVTKAQPLEEAPGASPPTIRWAGRSQDATWVRCNRPQSACVSSDLSCRSKRLSCAGHLSVLIGIAQAPNSQHKLLDSLNDPLGPIRLLDKDAARRFAAKLPRLRTRVD